MVIIMKHLSTYNDHYDCFMVTIMKHLSTFLDIFVRPEKFQFMKKGQNRNFDYEIVISFKKSGISSLDLG